MTTALSRSKKAKCCRQHFTPPIVSLTAALCTSGWQLHPLHFKGILLIAYGQTLTTSLCITLMIYSFTVPIRTTMKTTNKNCCCDYKNLSWLQGWNVPTLYIRIWLSQIGHQFWWNDHEVRQHICEQRIADSEISYGFVSIAQVNIISLEIYSAISNGDSSHTKLTQHQRLAEVDMNPGYWTCVTNTQ